MDNAIIVLPREIIVNPPEATDEPALFYAVDGDSGNRAGAARRPQGVSRENISEFLSQNRSKIWLSCGAVRLHQICTQAVGEDRNLQSIVWELPQSCRLWDIALLQQRIHYAYLGEIIEVPDLQSLFQHWLGADQSSLRFENQLNRVRRIFENQIDWAVRELPLFWKITPPNEGDFSGEQVSNNAYCYAMICADPSWCDSDGIPLSHVESEDIDRHRVNRRRNLALSGRYGPLGIGLDLQAALLSENLNNLDFQIDNDTLRAALRHSRSYGSRQSAPHEATASTLRSRLDAIGRYVDVPLSEQAPESGDSNDFVIDFFDFRGHDEEVKSLLNNEIQRKFSSRLRASGSFAHKYRAFPNLFSDVAELLAEEVELPFLLPRDGNHRFLELRFDDLEIRTLLATNVALYGISPALLITDYSDETAFPAEIYRYVSDNIGHLLDFGIRHYELMTRSEIMRMIIPFGMIAENLPLFREMLEQWRSFSLEQRNTLIDTVLSGVVLLEDGSRSSSRLRNIGIELSPQHILWYRVLIWRALSSCHGFSEEDGILPSVSLPNIPAPGLIHSSDVVTPVETAVGWEISEMPLHLVVNQICSKTDLPWPDVERRLRALLAEKTAESESESESDESPRFWSVVNYFVKHKAKAWREIGLSQAISSEELTALGRTNAVSSSGRIGRPIHYANALVYDHVMLKKDFIVSTAFSLFARDLHVVWVSEQSIVLEIAADSSNADLMGVTVAVRNAATKLFQTAGVVYSDFSDWLARGACTCRILASWPRGEAIQSSFDYPSYSIPSPPLPRSDVLRTFCDLMKNYSIRQEGDILWPTQCPENFPPMQRNN